MAQFQVKVKESFGKAILEQKSKSPLWESFSFPNQVWMSHQDIVQKLPKGFKTIASSLNSKFAVIANEKFKYYGVQFHPEVSHTEKIWNSKNE